MKKLKSLFICVFVICFFILSIKMHAQISNALYKNLPERYRPVPANKTNLTVTELYNIIDNQRIYLLKSHLREMDSLANILAQIDKGAISMDDRYMAENELMSYYFNKGNFAAPMTYCNSQIVIAEKNKDSSIYQLIRFKAELLVRLSEYEKSILLLNTALDIIKNHPDSLQIAEIFIGFHFVYSALELHQEALNYIDSACAYLGKMQTKSRYSLVEYSNLLQESILENLDLFEQTNDTLYLHRIGADKPLMPYLAIRHLNKPLLFELLPMLQAYSLNNFERARFLCDSLLKTHDNFLNNWSFFCGVYLLKYKAISLYKTGHVKKATQLLDNIIDTIGYDQRNNNFSNQYGYPLLNKINYFLYQYCSDQKQWRRACYYLAIAKTSDDSLSILKNRSTIIEAKIKYNYAIKEATVNHLQADIVNTRKKTNLVFAIIFVGVLFISLFLMNLIRETNLKKKLEELRLKSEIDRINMESNLLIFTLEEKNRMMLFDEKRKLGMELHDGLANELAALKISLETHLLKVKDHSDALEIMLAKETLNTAYEKIRQKSHDLFGDEHQQEMLSFIDIIKNILQTPMLLQEYKLGISIDEFALEEVNMSVKIEMLRMIQELITNIIKHAHATEIDLLIYEEFRNIVLCVKDNGNGFQKNITATKKGIGIASIMERAAKLNGNAEIISGKKGTEINIKIPIAI